MKSLVNTYAPKRSFYSSYIYAASIGFFIYVALGLELHYVLAITIFAHQFFLLYMKLGDRIPVRNLIGTDITKFHVKQKEIGGAKIVIAEYVV